MIWRAHVGSTRVDITPQGAHFRLNSAQTSSERPLKSKVGEKRLVFIFGMGPTRPGGPSMAKFTPVIRAVAAPWPRLKYILCLNFQRKEY